MKNIKENAQVWRTLVLKAVRDINTDKFSAAFFVERKMDKRHFIAHHKQSILMNKNLYNVRWKGEQFGFIEDIRDLYTTDLKMNTEIPMLPRSEKLNELLWFRTLFWDGFFFFFTHEGEHTVQAMC